MRDDRYQVLQKEETDIFDVFVYWLYTPSLYPSKENFSIDTGNDDEKERTTVNLTQAMLAKVWLFGDRGGVPELQIAIIDALHKHVLDSWSFVPVIVRLAFENTVATCQCEATELLHRLIHFLRVSTRGY